MSSPDDRIGRQAAVDPDDDRKPESPSDLGRGSWRFVVRKTFREFSVDQCLDLAAALTYYAILAVAPAMLALVSLIGLVGDKERVVEDLLGIVSDVAPPEVLTVVEPIVEQAASADRAGLALVVGVVVALWSASGYVGAFGRALNRIYEIEEGRPLWKLRPVMLLVTVAAVVITGLVVAGLVMSGPVAQTVGDLLGVGATAVTVWQIVKWPVVLALVVIVVALLYQATPNVRQPRFRWLSVGAVVAIVVWAIASAVFALYLTTFANYGQTYGSLAGVIVFLLWLWLTNLALLFGAELDAELERARELQGGLPAEETIQLPPRDTTASDKRAAKERADVSAARALRSQHTEGGERRETDPSPEPTQRRGEDTGPLGRP